MIHKLKAFSFCACLFVLLIPQCVLGAAVAFDDGVETPRSQVLKQGKWEKHTGEKIRIDSGKSLKKKARRSGNSFLSFSIPVEKEMIIDDEASTRKIFSAPRPRVRRVKSTIQSLSPQMKRVFPSEMPRTFSESCVIEAPKGHSTPSVVDTTREEDGIYPHESAGDSVASDSSFLHHGISGLLCPGAGPKGERLSEQSFSILTPGDIFDAQVPIGKVYKFVDFEVRKQKGLFELKVFEITIDGVSTFYTYDPKTLRMATGIKASDFLETKWRVYLKNKEEL